MPVTFRRAAEIREQARAICDAERRRIATLVPAGELSLTGASSIPEALTRGDVDLHLRVPAEDFHAAVRSLTNVYAVVLPEIWSRTLATFAVDAPLPTGVAVTPIGSEHDIRFRRAWRLLSSDPEELERYNDLKRRHAGGDTAAYEGAKAAFFSRLVDDGR